MFEGRKELREPSVFGRKQTEAPHVEEEEELVYPDMKEFGPGKMAELVDYYKDGKGQDYLDGFQQNSHYTLFINSLALANISLLVARISVSPGSFTKEVRSMQCSTIAGIW